MSYEFITTGERVILDVIANADKSILDICVDGFRTIIMLFDEYYALCQKIGYPVSYSDLFFNFSRNYALVEKEGKSNEMHIIVLESKGDIFGALNLFDMLKIYKPLDVFSCHSINYVYRDGKVRFGGLGRILNLIPDHSLVLSEKYFLTTEESSNFNSWHSSHMDVVSCRNTNEIYKNAIHLYIKSYNIPDWSASFLMLMIVLEMLFSNDTKELSYRIKRGCGYFLSNNREEMEGITKRVGELYNARSKYVHTGKMIELEKLYELRKIIRDILVQMYARNMHIPEYNFKQFRDSLTYCGYTG